MFQDISLFNKKTRAAETLMAFVRSSLQARLCAECSMMLPKSSTHRDHSCQFSPFIPAGTWMWNRRDGLDPLGLSFKDTNIQHRHLLVLSLGMPLLCLVLKYEELISGMAFT